MMPQALNRMLSLLSWLVQERTSLELAAIGSKVVGEGGDNVTEKLSRSFYTSAIGDRSIGDGSTRNLHICLCVRDPLRDRKRVGCQNKIKIEAVSTC